MRDLILQLSKSSIYSTKPRDCYRVFLLTYTYEARKHGVKEKITEMAFNGAGVCDTARTLKIGINTVIRTLKNSRHDE